MDPQENLPLVSVVTPSYQAMPYIIDAVKSVQTQDYPKMEYIVMDGGSTDGTVEFLQTCPQLVWVSEVDRGQSHALNKGFQRARGEIVGWLNADDTYRPGAVSTAVRYLLNHPDIDLIYSDLQIIDEQGAFVGITRSQTFDVEKLLLTNFIKQTTVFMRKRILDRLQGVNEDLHYVMDRELWLRAGIAGFQMHYLKNQILANFRLIPGTKSYEHTPQFCTEWLQVLEKAFELPALQYISPSTREILLRKTKAQYHWANFVLELERKNRRGSLYHFVETIRKNPEMLTNRGTWLLMVRGILGLGIDRLRKFKKASSSKVLEL